MFIIALNKQKQDLSDMTQDIDILKEIGKEKALEIFKKIYFTRCFELEVKDSYDRGDINCYIYLSVGQEAISSAVSSFFPADYIFTQHRAHSVYLAYGGDPIKLRDELLGKDSGCSKGKGGSPGIQDPKIGMIGHHGLIGENIPLAVGVALGDSEKKVVCFFGDGAAEEDYVFPSLGFAAKHKLPVLFICEDNNLSILTKKSERRDWKLVDLAKSLGVQAVDLPDDPFLIVHYVKKFKDNLPALINCKTCRHLWHTGTGVDDDPEYDRLELVKDQLNKYGFGNEIKLIEEKVKKEVKEIWQRH